ncbi:MAG: SMI1/KNR4 family protein [Pseudomonadota bacterium]
MSLEYQKYTELRKVQKKLGLGYQDIGDEQISELDRDSQLFEYLGRARLPVELESVIYLANGTQLDPASDEAAFWSFIDADDLIETLEAVRESPFPWSGIANSESECWAPQSGRWPEEWVPFINWNGSILGVYAGDRENAGAILGVAIDGAISLARWANSLDAFFDQLILDYETKGSPGLDALLDQC